VIYNPAYYYDVADAMSVTFVFLSDDDGRR
jgi:hypothetical protein